MTRPKTWPTVAALAVAAAVVLYVQGLRMAADRQEFLLPARGPSVSNADGDSVAVVELPARFAVLDLSVRDPLPSRVALYQLLPSRPLIRWIEPLGAKRGALLVIPLEGLDAGSYAVCAVSGEASAGPQEMDVPTVELDVVVRWELRGAGGSTAANGN